MLPPATVTVPVPPVFDPIVAKPDVTTVPPFTVRVALPLPPTWRPLSCRLPPAETVISPMPPGLAPSASVAELMTLAPSVTVT